MITTMEKGKLYVSKSLKIPFYCGKYGYDLIFYKKPFMFLEYKTLSGQHTPGGISTIVSYILYEEKFGFFHITRLVEENIERAII